MIVRKLFALAGLASSCLLVLSIAVLAQGDVPAQAGPCGLPGDLPGDLFAQHRAER